MMNNGLTQFAEALVFVHGPLAESEAARQAILCERAGQSEFAEIWRELQRTLRKEKVKLAA